MRNSEKFFVCSLIIFSCASSNQMLRDVEFIADISSIRADETVTEDTAESILKHYTIEFKIPNPLYGSSEQSSRRVDPNHEDTIYCSTILLDKISTEADIFVHCQKDSLDAESCKEFRKEYHDLHIRDGMFRIRVSMESGFSLKSMEPEHWALYIENTRGIMLEPADIKASEVTALQDTIYSDYHRINLPRSLLLRDVTLYFKRTTFFGEDLFGGENPFIVFVMSHEKNTVARVGWNISGTRE